MNPVPHLTPQDLFPCPIHQWTGLLCPGCGGTHCLLALLHGNLAQAWHSNPLLTLLLPAAALLAVAHVVARTRGLASPATRLLQSRAAILTVCGITAAFTLARNLP